MKQLAFLLLAFGLLIQLASAQVGGTYLNQGCFAFNADGTLIPSSSTSCPLDAIHLFNVSSNATTFVSTELTLGNGVVTGNTVSGLSGIFSLNGYSYTCTATYSSTFTWVNQFYTQIVRENTTIDVYSLRCTQTGTTSPSYLLYLSTSSRFATSSRRTIGPFQERTLVGTCANNPTPPLSYCSCVAGSGRTIVCCPDGTDTYVQVLLSKVVLYAETGFVYAGYNRKGQPLEGWWRDKAYWGVFGWGISFYNSTDGCITRFSGMSIYRI